MYELRYTEQSIKDLQKLEKTIAERILNSIERIRIAPQRYVERLVGSEYYKLRIGDYRVILDVRNYELIILIITVGHRKNVYD